MKRLHKNLRKVLAIVLVCAMLTMSMGAYSGEDEELCIEVSDIKLQYYITNTIENSNVYVESNELHNSSLINVTLSDNYKNMYESESGEFYKKNENNTFVKMNKHGFSLCDKNLVSKLETFKVPGEIIDRIIAFRDSLDVVANDVNIVMFSQFGLEEIEPVVEYRYGTTWKTYNVDYEYCSQTFTLVEGTTINEALLKTIKEVVFALDPTEKGVLSLIGSTKSIFDVWQEVTENQNVNISLDNRIEMKLYYTFYQQYTLMKDSYDDRLTIKAITSAVRLSETKVTIEEMNDYRELIEHDPERYILTSNNFYASPNYYDPVYLAAKHAIYGMGYEMVSDAHIIVDGKQVDFGFVPKNEELPESWFYL